MAPGHQRGREEALTHALAKPPIRFCFITARPNWRIVFGYGND